MDNLLAGTRILRLPAEEECRGIVQRHRLTSLWKTFRSKPISVPLRGRKVIGLPAESRSASVRNGDRLHSGTLIGTVAEW
jgi:hypothetical protein